jgi:hypothetical protein
LSILLTGKFSRLLIRLGLSASSDVATKLDTLHDSRLTAARAANLDKLDAPISTVVVGGIRRAVQILSGSGSWTHPANVKDNLVEVTLVGGGGAGGRLSGAGNGGTGGDGGKIILRIPFVLAGGSTAYSVGAGGVGRATDGNGAAGNPTTFGLLSASGGGTSNPTSPSPSTGINGTLGAIINDQSTTGGEGANDGGGDSKAGGSYRGAGGAADAGSGGGGAAWGNGGNAVAAGGAGANAAANSGAGGGGCNSGTSGAGGSGYILIEYEEAG